jgi:hypothetical protein
MMKQGNRRGQNIAHSLSILIRDDDMELGLDSPESTGIPSPASSTASTPSPTTASFTIIPTIRITAPGLATTTIHSLSAVTKLRTTDTTAQPVVSPTSTPLAVAVSSDASSRPTPQTNTRAGQSQVDNYNVAGHNRTALGLEIAVAALGTLFQFSMTRHDLADRDT